MTDNRPPFRLWVVYCWESMLRRVEVEKALGRRPELIPYERWEKGYLGRTKKGGERK